MSVAVEQTIIDVEMKDAQVEDLTDTDQKDTDATAIQDIRENIRQIERGVTNKESRFIIRVIRSIVSNRKELNLNVLTSIINGFYTHSVPEKEFMLSFFEDQMDVDGANTNVAQRMRTVKNSTCPLLPEVDAYIHMLIVLHLIDQCKYVEAQKCSDALIEKLSLHSRRTLDLIQARCFFYHMRAYEMNNEMDKFRPLFHAKLRSASLRNDFEGQAVLINCLLRSYLHYSLYDQADKLVSKSIFPETASNNEWARFLYYVGRIKAIRLEYSEAHTNLVQALRKAPQKTAVGFRQAVQKLLVTVELLLGDIPDRLIFREAAMRNALQPYFELTQAVRLGNLHTFSEVLNKFNMQFQEDKTFLMIIRLRHNVIKTGIRAISASYSRITPDHVARKLGLDSAQDAEYIISKAIRDGVIEAFIDPVKGYMQTKESTDIYGTAEPQIAFHERTQFCLELHNQSVKAMRYPPKSYGKDLESAEERREREQQDLELAKEMADDEDDGFP